MLFCELLSDVFWIVERFFKNIEVGKCEKCEVKRVCKFLFFLVIEMEKFFERILVLKM